MVVQQLESIIPVERGIEHPSSRRLLILSVLFIAAFGIRLYHINEPPLNFHATRQYRSLIIAREYYFYNLSSVPGWKKEVAHFSRRKQGMLEPPILEFLVSIGYRLLGGEHFWLPQLLSSLFWLIGGGFLYLIGKRIADADAAVFATAFYLFLPFGVIASRSFQPDPLMIMLLLGSVLGILRLYDAPSKSRLTMAAVISALAFLVKPGSVFVIVGVFMALAISREGTWRALITRTTLVFLMIALLPALMIYVYSIFTGRFLLGEAEKTLLPQLWISPFFWQSWLNNIGLTVGFVPFIAALFGVLLFRQGLPRMVMIGFWTGYVVFALVLDYNVATHNYYQLQLIPIVGLSTGPIVALAMNHVNRINSQFPWHLAAWPVLLLGLVLSIGVARSTLLNSGAERKARTEQEIGELVNHSTRTIFLASDYGVPLEYHGLLSGAAWPIASDLQWEQLAGVPVLGAAERFNAWFAKDSPEYFIVEDFREFERQPDLRQFLSQFPVVSQNSDYLIIKLSRS
jgi:4-amino-4-deoxy-L-arabinose transferase-like glycosyltransferase